MKKIVVERPIARPFLKWAGGKTSSLQSILPRLPEKFNTYYEPFIGGGAVFFALAAENRFKHAVLSDSNTELMLAYSAVAGSVLLTVEELNKHTRSHSEDYYYRVRGLDKTKGFSGLSVVKRAARLIYLNRTCFNGLYRVNKDGHFNTPFGDYKNPTICDSENLYAASDVLRKAYISISALDFEDATWPAIKGDVVYFDPPYMPVSKTANFTAYAKGGFGPDEHERLRNVADKLSARGVHVLLSNSDTPFVRELYDGFLIEEVQAPRRVNSKGSKRGNVGELLISGK